MPSPSDLVGGWAHCRRNIRYSEEILAEKLKNQEVVKVEQINRKIDKVLTPISFLIISFYARVTIYVESSVVVATSLNLRTTLFSMLSLSFFGDVGWNCRRQANKLPVIYERCGLVHNAQCTAESLKSPNYQGLHPTSFKKWEHYPLNKEVVTLKTVEKLTFSEACNRVLPRCVHPGCLNQTQFYVFD